MTIFEASIASMLLMLCMHAMTCLGHAASLLL
jgi:hypothetical protein